MPNYHITVHGADREAMADLVRAYRVRVYGQTLTEEDTGYRVSALADEETITRLQAEGYRVEQHEDVDEAARDSLRDVGQGNRFLDQGRDGVADKDPGAEPAAPSVSQRPVMTYLNVEEVETAIALAAGAPNAGFTELITLPNQTWEGRACHAIRVHQGAPARSGVYLLGGIHAREWGSPDILVNFCATTHRRLPRWHWNQPGWRVGQRRAGARHRRDPGCRGLPAGQPGWSALLDDDRPDVAQEPPADRRGRSGMSQRRWQRP